MFLIIPDSFRQTLSTPSEMITHGLFVPDLFHRKPLFGRTISHLGTRKILKTLNQPEILKGTIVFRTVVVFKNLDNTADTTDRKSTVTT